MEDYRVYLNMYDNGKDEPFMSRELARAMDRKSAEILYYALKSQSTDNIKYEIVNEYGAIIEF